MKNLAKKISTLAIALLIVLSLTVTAQAFDYDLVSVDVVDGVEGWGTVTTINVGDVLLANIITNDPANTTIGGYPVDAQAHYVWHYSNGDSILGTDPYFSVTSDNFGHTLALTITHDAYNGTLNWTAALAVGESPAPASPSASPETSPSPLPEEPSPTPYFNYVDIKGNWVEGYASDLAYSNVYVGNKINSKYYFNPDRAITRADYVIYLNALLGFEPDDYDSKDSPFADNMPNWLENHAKAAYENGVISGIEIDGVLYFKPYEVLNRVEATKMLANAILIASGVMPEDVLGFADSADIPTWAVSDIKSLVGAGIVNGFEDNTFRPFDPINHSAAAKLMSVTSDWIETHPLPSPVVSPSVSNSPDPTASPTASTEALKSLFRVLK